MTIFVGHQESKKPDSKHRSATPVTPDNEWALGPKVNRPQTRQVVK